jgi:hypothetical protein
MSPDGISEAAVGVTRGVLAVSIGSGNNAATDDVSANEEQPPNNFMNITLGPRSLAKI